jgi:hypothetical protein
VQKKIHFFKDRGIPAQKKARLSFPSRAFLPDYYADTAESTDRLTIKAR